MKNQNYILYLMAIILIVLWLSLILYGLEKGI